MKADTTTRKHARRGPADDFSCVLCGEEPVYNGIIFKGRCVCEECVAYVRAGRLTEEGHWIPPQSHRKGDGAGKSSSVIKKEKTASSPKSSRYPEGEIAAEEKDIYRSDKYSKNDERAEDD